MKGRDLAGERGQILLIVAAGLFFVMLGATAVAVDWGNGLLQKRRLQNTADAAALAAASELSQGGTIATAVSAAQNIVSSSTGGAVSLPYPGTGSGTGLSNGIELSTAGEVRVALVRQVKTMFAPILGMNTLTVRARSRAVVGPYGVLPIAFKRFSDGDTSFALNTGTNPPTVRDYLAPANFDTITSWPSPLTLKSSEFDHKDSAGNTVRRDAELRLPDAYDPNVNGRVVPLIGQNAVANIASGNDFHFFVAPDVRDITNPQPTFYNGVQPSTSIQQLKDMESSYFYSPTKPPGYPGPNPFPGQQVGILNGTNTSLTVDAIRKSFGRGSVVTAMVYNGTVYRRPEFDLQLDSAIKTSGSPIVFHVTLVPRNNFVGDVQLSAIGLENWGQWWFANDSPGTTHVVSIAGSPVTVDFSIMPNSSSQGARTALIVGYDWAGGTTRTASATVVVGTASCFSQSTPQAFQVVEAGSGTSFELDLQGWGASGYDQYVSFSSLGWYDNPSTPSGSPPTGVTVTMPDPTRVRKDHLSKVKLNISVASNASLGTHMLKVRASDGDSTHDQDMYLTVSVIPPDTQPTAGSTTSFVVVLGYANFVITYAGNATSPSPSLDNNTIYAYAVSPLMADPNDLPGGMGARLIGWNQTR